MKCPTCGIVLMPHEKDRCEDCSPASKEKRNAYMRKYAKRPETLEYQRVWHLARYRAQPETERARTREIRRRKRANGICQCCSRPTGIKGKNSDGEPVKYWCCHVHRKKNAKRARDRRAKRARKETP